MCSALPITYTFVPLVRARQAPPDQSHQAIQRWRPTTDFAALRTDMPKTSGPPGSTPDSALRQSVRQAGPAAKQTPLNRPWPIAPCCEKSGPTLASRSKRKPRNSAFCAAYIDLVLLSQINTAFGHGLVDCCCWWICQRGCAAPCVTWNMITRIGGQDECVAPC